MNTPLVSVILPAYNAERHLREAIDSMLFQTYSKFELIIINDGSDDSTEQIICSYSDPRIKYVKNEKNLRLIKTLNKGVDLAQGDYIARMDADDISMPNRLQVELDFLQNNPDVDVVSMVPMIMDSFGNITHKSRHFLPLGASACRFACLFECAVVHPNCMVKTSKLKKYKYSLQKYAEHVEDYELWSRMLADNCNVVVLNECLFKYRISAESVCSQNRKEQYLNGALISYRNLKEYGFISIDKDRFVKMYSKNTLSYSDLKQLFSLINTVKDKYIVTFGCDKTDINEINAWIGKTFLEKIQVISNYQKLKLICALGGKYVYYLLNAMQKICF